MDGSNFSYGREKEPKPYLRCTYGEGMHHNEYFIGFTTTEKTAENNLMLVNNDGAVAINASGLENHMWVNKVDVLTKEDVSSLR